MGTRRIKVIGVSAAVLAVTACGIAASNSGGTAVRHPASVSARHAAAAAPITDQEQLARVKRHAAPPAGDAGVRRPQADTSSFKHQYDAANLRRSIAVDAAQQARNR